jgi:hypothetical protein
MPTMKDVCNQGLGKIGASRVNNLTPAVSVLEVKCAAEYAQWKASELQQRRWTFSTILSQLTAAETLTSAQAPDGRIYRFDKPADLLRAIRPKNCTWVMRGQSFYDFANIVNLEYIRNVPDNELSDALFVDVLAARVAVECAELASQSPAKKRDAVGMRKDAIEVAGRMNAFTLDESGTEGDDTGYTWDMARLYPWGMGW